MPDSRESSLSSPLHLLDPDNEHDAHEFVEFMIISEKFGLNLAHYLFQTPQILEQLHENLKEKGELLYSCDR